MAPERAEAPQSIPFRGEAGQESTTDITICNMTTRRVAYKVKSNQPTFVKITPNALGSLSPGEQYVVQLCMDKKFDWKVQQCKVLLQSAYIPLTLPEGEYEIAKIWDQLELYTDTSMEAFLDAEYCALEGPDLMGDGQMRRRRGESVENLTTIFLEKKGQDVPKVMTDMTGRTTKGTMVTEQLGRAPTPIDTRDGVHPAVALKDKAKPQVAADAPSVGSRPPTMGAIVAARRRSLTGVPLLLPTDMVNWLQAQPPEILQPCLFIAFVAGMVGILIGVLLGR